MSIFTKKVPQRLSNIVQGIFFIVLAFPATFLLWVFVATISGGTLAPSDYPVSNTPFYIATIVAGLAFLLQIIYGIYVIVQKVEEK